MSEFIMESEDSPFKRNNQQNVSVNPFGSVLSPKKEDNFCQSLAQRR